MHIYLKFESYNLQSKTWFIKVSIFISKMLSKTYTRASVIPRIFSRVTRTPVEWEEREVMGK